MTTAYQIVKSRIPPHVKLVAVSKTYFAPDLRPVLDAGQRLFGENRVQEAKEKWPELRAEFPDVDCREILSDVIDGALIPTRHPLATKKKITFDDIGNFPFLFFPREFHPAFYDFVIATFAECGYSPVMGPKQEGLLTIWSLAAEGEGWSFGFGSQGIDPPPGLVAVPIDGFSIPWGIDMLTRKGESRPTTLTVIALLLKAAAASI